MKLTITFLIIFMSFVLKSQTVEFYSDEKNGSNNVIGYCQVNDFKESPFSDWFLLNFENYVPSRSVIDDIKKSFYDNMRIQIILGTWCGDSKEQVPRFFKILEKAQIPLNVVEIICVNRTKTAPGINIQNKNIEKVPTFIIFRDDVEIGRIIETPIETLEIDLYKILNK